MVAREVLIGMVKVNGARCRCGHEWMPWKKGDRPKVCPKCKSPNWDVPKRVDGGGR